MQLQPVTTTREVSYPTRIPGSRSGLLRSLKRAALAACASGALLLGGCYGATPANGGGEETETIEINGLVTGVMQVYETPEEDPELLAGDVAAPAFTCGSVQEWAVGWAPGWVEGSLCGEEIAMAAVEVTTEGDYELLLENNAEAVLVSILSPDGEEVAQLGPEAPSAIVTMTAGRWSLEATPVDPVENGSAWFSLSINAVDR